MFRKSRIADRETVVESPEDSGNRPMVITTRHTLLTDDWTGDVQTIETAIRDFKADRPFRNNCQVVLFEMVSDRHLHVNVTHKYPTKHVSGWAGPGSLPEGHVYNRLFGFSSAPSRIVRHIRDMVFAARI